MNAKLETYRDKNGCVIGAKITKEDGSTVIIGDTTLRQSDTVSRHADIMEMMGTDPDAVADRLVSAEDALMRIAQIPNNPGGGDWDEIEEARRIAESFFMSNTNKP